MTSGVGVVVGLTTWDIGTPVGAAVGVSLFGVAVTSLIRGNMKDETHSAITGIAAGPSVHCLAV